MRMRMFAGQSPNLSPFAMTIFSAKASVMRREAEVTAAGRCTTPAVGGPAMGGRAAAIPRIPAPALDPVRALAPAELSEKRAVGGGGGGAGVGCAGFGLTVTCAVLPFPSLSAVTLTMP